MIFTKREAFLQQVACDKIRFNHQFTIHDDECNEPFRWTDSWLKRVFKSMAILLLLSPLSCYGVDLSSGIRNMQKHGAWMSFEVRNSLTGMFLASRASIVDETTGAILNFTFLPGDQCQSVAVLLFQLDSLSSKKIQEEATVELKVDNEPQQLIPASFIVEADDKFAFFDISKNIKSAELSGHESVEFTVEGFGSTKFSMDSFDEARQEAQSTCKGFMPINVIRE